MIIQIDTREKQRAIKNIVNEFDANKIKHYSSKLYVGDYMNLDNPKTVIDRKQSLNELYQNVCQGHKRFLNELKRALEAETKMIILCEHGDGIKTLEDVKKWKNPRLELNPYAWDGARLYKVLKTICEKYKTKFLFCEKSETGKRIIEILEEG